MATPESAAGAAGPQEPSLTDDLGSAEAEAGVGQSPLQQGRTLSMHQLTTELLEDSHRSPGAEQPGTLEAPAEQQPAVAAAAQPDGRPKQIRSGLSGLRMGDPGFERATSREPDFYLRMIGAKRAAASGTENGPLEQLSKQNDTMEKEVRLFTQYLARNRQALSTADDPAIDAADNRGSLLSLDEKCEVVSAEVELAEAVISQARREGETRVGEVRLQLRQLDDDILQAERETFDFRRIFLKTPGSGPHKRGHAPAVSAEKLMSFLDSQTKAKVAAVEKLFFKNTVAKDQGRKLEVQLEQHTLGGAVVGAVDYEKLRIENQQQAEILRKRNEELPRLRLSAGRATQALRSQQVELRGVMGEVATLQATLQQSQAQSATLAASTSMLRSTSTLLPGVRLSASSGRRSSEPRDVRPEASLPILDYVKITKENQELTAKLAEMESKYETAMSLTKKVKATLPKAARLTTTARSATRAGLRA